MVFSSAIKSGTKQNKINLLTVTLENLTNRERRSTKSVSQIVQI